MDNNKQLNRKEFIKKAALGTVGAGMLTAGCTNTTGTADSNAPNIITNKKFRWKMVTTWPPNFPVLGEGCQRFAQWVKDMSGGRMEIRVYGGGELVPALEAFDAVRSGAAEIGSGGAYYWAGMSPVTPFFTTIPFGLNAQQMNSWLYSAGGLELWEELYDRFNLIPFPGGNTGMQMGGWFNREINELSDIRGLKMRIPGLGGQVIEKAGGTAVLSPASELYTNLERGVIDATEWIGPYHDYLLGLHKIARYYYYPGWHEPCAALEIFINKRNFGQIPADIQEMIRTAAYRFNIWMLSEIESHNNVYLHKILAEGNVELRRFPDDVMSTFRQLAEEAVLEAVSKDPLGQKIFDSYRDFKLNIREWAEISEREYYNSIGA